MNGSKSSSTLMVFLFTDLVDSTGWKQSIGDVGYAQGILQPHNDLFRKLLLEFEGAIERNFTGDGFLATFDAPSAAVTFAIRFHEALQSHVWSAEVLATNRRPETRIGIHLGEAIPYADADPRRKQITGQAVDLAARIMGLAGGGQTLLTRHAFDSARQNVRDDLLSWLAHGQYRCKGSDVPLEVCEVGVPGRAPLAPPPASEKAKRVEVDAEADTGSWRPAVGLPIPRREGWTIEKKIGEGGFGEVWLARHQRTKNRRVFKFCFDADRLRSFKRELTFFKLIMKGLGDRDDIAKLHEVQVDEPPYSLESEYVEAGNLAHWVTAQGGIGNVRLATRLGLIAKIAQAVAAAHSLGIIHKDLKPSNILIKLDHRREPQPQLSDFGIGVLLDRDKLKDEAITDTGGVTGSMIFDNESSRTGTRLYSPPEASLGKPATTGFDIYAMGVMLFQMVTADLRRPLGTGWEKAVTVDGADGPIQAELLVEDITAATHVEPEKRLHSAAAFAERLQNLENRCQERLAELRRQVDERLAQMKRLEDERRAEERERRLQRLRRFTGVGIVVLFVVGALGVYAWNAKNRADEEARRAVAQEIEAKTQAKRADEKADEAEKQTKLAKEHFWKTVQMVDFLSSVAMNELENVPKMGKDQLELLERAEKNLRELLDDKSLDLQGDVAVRRKLAAAQRDLGFIWYKHLRNDAARKSFAEAASAYDQLAKEDPAHRKGHWNDWAFCQNYLGETFRADGKADEAEARYRSSLDKYQEGGNWFDENEKFLANLAMTENNLAIVLMGSRKHEEARTHLDNALERLKKLHKDPERLNVFVSVHTSYFFLHAEQKRYEDAKKEYQVLIDQLMQVKKQSGLGHHHQYGLGVAYRNWGDLLLKPVYEAVQAGKSKSQFQPGECAQIYVQAEEAFGRAHEQLADLASRFPRYPFYREELAKLHNSLGGLCLFRCKGLPPQGPSRMAELDKARKAFQEANRIANDLADDQDLQGSPGYKKLAAMVYRNQARVAKEAGDQKESDQFGRLAKAREEQARKK
jgi:serine/threonine protein kinase/class 3 adenylate cyclase